VRHLRAPIAAGELAGGKAQPRDRAAEAVFVDAHEIEAGLDRHAAHLSANRFAFDLQGASRQHGIAHLAGALELDGADDRAVRQDTALPAGAFEAGIIEKLADNEAANRPTVNAIPRNITSTPTDARFTETAA